VYVWGFLEGLHGGILNYDISIALIYQGSTNANYYDSYCKKYTVYYSQQAVTVENQGNVEWNRAGEYNDPDEGLNPDGLKAVKGKTVDSSLFSKSNGNMAVGCRAVASNEKLQQSLQK